MTRGGKREGAGRKSRKLETGKISAYIQDRDVLNKLAKLLKIPTVELLHQVVEHPDFVQLVMKIEALGVKKDWYKVEKPKRGKKKADL